MSRWKGGDIESVSEGKAKKVFQEGMIDNTYLMFQKEIIIVHFCDRYCLHRLR